VRIRRRLAMAGALTALSFGVLAAAATGAQASPAGGDGVKAGAATVADQCVYYVRYNNTPVQENPDTDSVVRKYKNAGERVTGPCRAAYDTESRVWFTAVDCSCATDGIGWIRSYWLY